VFLFLEFIVFFIVFHKYLKQISFYIDNRFQFS
jgi:hypothetical protein